MGHREAVEVLPQRHFHVRIVAVDGAGRVQVPGSWIRPTEITPLVK